MTSLKGRMRLSCVECLLVLAALLCSPAVYSQTAPAKRSSGSASAEERTARAFAAARTSSLELREFLLRMPKGADLHYHLVGGIYAETFIRDGAEDGLCVDLASHAFSRPTGGLPSDPSCGGANVPAAKAFSDQNLYDALVNAFSMRSFVPSPGVSAHDHFFDTFGKFGGTSPKHAGEWLDEIASRAAAQNEQYLELMETPPFSHAAELAKEIGWRGDFGEFRSELLARGLKDEIAAASAARDEAEAARRKIERCGEVNEAPACKITIRYLYQVLRGLPKETVFAQTLLGFETASADPRFVGINYVMPEDGTTSMADYALHMKMVGYLHAIYPRVHISLHAGELAEGLVPPEGLCCHIRLAVEEAHAERIGHGVDVMREDRPYELLKEMAAGHVMVEINLTSNDVILGIAGKDHPFPEYRKYHVPIALSTDDEGVSRIDLTHEYARAAETYGLNYADLKKMARTGLEHSFLPGESLWREKDDFVRRAAACYADEPGAKRLSPGCAAFLTSSEKARAQWELERRFHEFEASF